MKALGHRSLAAFLRVALRVVLILLYVLGAVALFGCFVTILYAYGVDVPFFFGDRTIEYRPTMAWLYTLILAVSLTATIVIVGRLRRIFATLAEGDPFVPENAIHLRVIWITLAIWELSRYALGGATMAITTLLHIERRGAGERSPVDVSLSVWFAVLTLIVLAEVFREGARMRQEQKLTI